MRLSAAALSAAAIAAITACVWAGCNGLSGDCELNLDCPDMSTSASTGPAPMCEGFLDPGPCNVCMVASCCAELAECGGDPTCLNDCLYGPWAPPSECQTGATKMHFDAAMTCAKAKCPACNAVDECNPITNAPCPSDGTACDTVNPGQFVCISPLGTPAKLCETCDDLAGPYCDGGLHCHQGSHKCARYCCTDADCGSGKCQTDPAVVFGEPLPITADAAVGICMTDLTAAATPACDAPATAASMGTCFTSYPPH